MRVISSVFLTELCLVCLMGCANTDKLRVNTSEFSKQDLIRVRENIDSIVSEIEGKYSIRISYNKSPKWTWGIVGYKKATASDSYRLLTFLKIFREEFDKYPPDFIARTKLKHVAFVKELSFLGQRRNAVPDYLREILYYDYAKASLNSVYQRHVIHHEFYHMIEEEINGNVYWKDPEWMEFNEKNFKYGRGGHKVQSNNKMYNMVHPKKGFVNLYSMSGLEEDKADIYASLFVGVEHEMLLGWIKDDDILREKVAYMKQFLYNCCKVIDEDYWKSLLKNNL